MEAPEKASPSLVRLQRAHERLGIVSSFSPSVLSLSRALSNSSLSALSIFKCISELSRHEMLEVLAYLCQNGVAAIPAISRIILVLRTHGSAWESVSQVITLHWPIRELAFLAISFGCQARDARDWSSCILAVAKDDPEARTALAAALETRRTGIPQWSPFFEDADILIDDWESEHQFEKNPSFFRELAWSSHARKVQDSRQNMESCQCLTEEGSFVLGADTDWLTDAEPNLEPLNQRYVRVCGALLRRRAIRKADADQSDGIDVTSNHNKPVQFAFTNNARRVFSQFACVLSSCTPIILEGPSGCGKSAAISCLAAATSHGFVSGASIASSTCFVQMDTAANSQESNEFASLIGCVVPLSNGKGFHWRLGPIGHAIVKGQWLVLENMECDSKLGNAESIAVIHQLASLRPGMDFHVPGRGQPLRAGLGFRLIATRTKTSRGEGKMSDWSPPGGWECWKCIKMEPLANDEQQAILALRFPSVFDCIPRVLKAISNVAAVIAERHRAFDRLPTLREAVRICCRLEQCSNSVTAPELSAELALLETLDVLVNWVSEQRMNTQLIEICADAWSLPVTVARALLLNRRAEILDRNNFVQIGRSQVPKLSATSRLHKSSRRLAQTSHTTRLLERIARCVQMGESVLLSGETGTGKTATLQELARLSNKKLVVVNMSRQSEIGDLIGGFRPLEIAVAMPDLVKRFERAFCSQMSRQKNEKFLDALRKAARSQHLFSRALRLMSGAIRAIPTPVRNSSPETTQEWFRIERLIAKVGKANGPSLHSVHNENENNSKQKQSKPPPRKRRRSNPKENEHARPLDDTGQAETESNDIGPSHTKSQSSRRVEFEFVDGVLVNALKSGHWVLLDEINLAPVEVLEYLVTLLDHGSVTVPNESGGIISAANGFALFAAMNPPNDFGKRPLSNDIRSRMTEFYVDDIHDRDDIAILVADRFYGVDTTAQNARRLSPMEISLTHDVADFFVESRKLAAEGAMNDAAGKCPRFSLRSLSQMLNYAVGLSRYMNANAASARRAIFEGALVAFVTPLPRSARETIKNLASVHFLQERPRTRVKKKPNRTLKEPNDLIREIRVPQNAMFKEIVGFPLEVNIAETSIHPDVPSKEFIVTSGVRQTLKDVCRILTYGVQRIPILLQGPTSAGKTSLVSFLAELTGNQLIRINNHEHTDLGEYLGAYVADVHGSIVFREGPLVKAVREGLWVVLDELNLAPPEILESLNRLLDDNKEVRIPETGEVVKAHKNFTIFATQNPPGLYGGRKELSRAFRGRFVEVQVDELPDNDLVEILENRCQVPHSFALKMVAVMRELQTRRQASRLFSGKSGFVTARDLFRWGCRRPTTREELAIHGFFLLGERARNLIERETVQEVLADKIGIDIALLKEKALYGAAGGMGLSLPVETEANESQVTKAGVMASMRALGISETPHMLRMITLLLHCALNNEPALLVGPTGSGKTSACAVVSKVLNIPLLTINCHRHIESSDFVGGFRPNSMGQGKDAQLFRWQDGPLVTAMCQGSSFLVDEINMADDAVIERLNSVLETRRSLLLSEKYSGVQEIVAHFNFRIFATMNPGGDFGKKELSPALRNRFTEIWIPAAASLEDFIPVIRNRLKTDTLNAALYPAQKALQETLGWLVQGHDSSTESLNFSTRSIKISLRDVVTWSNFVTRATEVFDLHPLVAYAHGARLVLLDGLFVGSTSKGTREQEEAMWGRILEQVPLSLREEASRASFQQSDVIIRRMRGREIGESCLHVGPFLLRNRQESSSISVSPSSFSFLAPCTSRNAARVVRAMAVDSRPLLLEGPPGAGKTSLLDALATATGVDLLRVNLSESTEMSDLVGGDVPSSTAGHFKFRKGPLLGAIETGKWILLDEMNLASQSVLEGLNALLDHRRSIYVPELAIEVVADENFRLFAAQNPSREGGGRVGLPQSFLNRFTKVSVESPSENDLVLIASATHPELDVTLVSKIVQTLSQVRNYFKTRKGNAIEADFSLRHVLRWCDIMSGAGDVYPHESFPGNDQSWKRKSPARPELGFDLVVLQALDSVQDREAAMTVFNNVFSLSAKSIPDVPSIRCVDYNFIRFGWPIVYRSSHVVWSSVSGFSPFLLESRSRELQALAMAANAGWPCIVAASSTLTDNFEAATIVKCFASLCGRKLVTFRGGSLQDADDLLGSYVQRDISVEVQVLKFRALRIYDDLLNQLLEAKDSVSECSQKKLRDMEEVSLMLREHAVSNSLHCPSLKDILLLILKLADILSTEFPVTSHTKSMLSLRKSLENLLAFDRTNAEKTNPSFLWRKSELIEAVERGDWVLLEDADKCMPSILDRLNPLFESAKPFECLGKSPCEKCTPKPFLLPEAPPQENGNPQFAYPHVNFRIFLSVSAMGERKLSRAVRDRSTIIKLQPQGHSFGFQNEALFGKKSGVTTMNASALQTSIADFVVSPAHTLRKRDLKVMNLLVKRSNDRLHSRLADTSGDFFSQTQKALGRLKDSCKNLEANPLSSNLLLDQQSSLARCSTEIFLLRSLSKKDLMRRLLFAKNTRMDGVRHLIELDKHSGLVPGKLSSSDLSSLSDLSSRIDICVDPLYGLDCALSSGLRSCSITFDDRFRRFQAIALRVLILSIAQLLSRWNIQSSRTDKSCSTLVSSSLFFESMKQATSVDSFMDRLDLQKSAKSILLYITYPLISHIVDLAKVFRTIIDEISVEQSWILPEENTWLELFDTTALFCEFSSTQLKSNHDVAFGFTLGQEIAKLTKGIQEEPLWASRTEPARLLSKVAELACFFRVCDLRNAVLPIPRREEGLKMERCLLRVCVSPLFKTLSAIEQETLIKGVVCIPSVFSDDSLGAKRELRHLEKISLERLAEFDSEYVHPPEEYAIDDLWSCFLECYEESLNRILLSKLRKMISNHDDRAPADLKNLALIAKKHAKTDSRASIHRLISLQRLHWCLNGNSHLRRGQLLEILNELKLVILQDSNRRSIFGLSELSSEQVYCSVSGSAMLLNSLVALNRVSGIYKCHPAGEDAFCMNAISCSLIAGEPYFEADGHGSLSDIFAALESLKEVHLVHKDFWWHPPPDSKNGEGRLISAITSIIDEVVHRLSILVGATQPMCFRCLVALKSIFDSKKLCETTRESWLLVAKGFLWVIAGVFRISSVHENVVSLHELDPSLLSEANSLFSSLKAVWYYSRDIACTVSSSCQLGGDTLASSIPKVRSEKGANYFSERASKAKSMVIERPAGFATYGAFVAALKRVVALVSDHSVIWQSFILLFQNSLLPTNTNLVSENVVENVQNVLETACQALELGGDFSHLRDVGGNVAIGLREVQYGLLTFLKGLKINSVESNQEISTAHKSLSEIIQFPWAAAYDGFQTKTLLSKCEQYGMSVNIQLSLIQSVCSQPSQSSEQLANMANSGFSNIVAAWKSNLLKEASDEAASNSLFAIKEHSARKEFRGGIEVDDVAFDEEKDFSDIFQSSLEEQIEALIIDEHQFEEIASRETSNGDSIPSRDKDRMEREIKSLDAEKFWEHHSVCFLQRIGKEHGTGVARKHALESFLSSLGASERSLAISSNDSAHSLAIISSCSVSSKVFERDYGGIHNKRSTGSRQSETSTYNFYKDSNGPEVFKMCNLLVSLEKAILKVQKNHFQADGGHPVLAMVHDFTKRARHAASLTSSLGSLVTVIEGLLRRADEWQRLFAFKEIRLEEEVMGLSRLASRWRRLEIDSWPNLLQSRVEHAKRQAEKWFYHLYDSLVCSSRASQMKKEQVDEIVIILDQFLRSSPRGEFQTRLDMLLSLAIQLKTCSELKKNNIGNYVYGICSYYEQFCAVINDALTQGKVLVEKKMRDFCQLSSWKSDEELGSSSKMMKAADKELEYFRLKSNSDKLKRRLHKLCRETDCFLKRPVFEEISKEIKKWGFSSLSNERNEINPKKNATETRSSFSCMIDDAFRQEFVSCLPVGLFEDYKLVHIRGKLRLVRIPFLMKRMKELSIRCQQDSEDLIDRAISVCTFLKYTIRSRSLHLRSSENVNIQAKKRALVDLLRALERVGLLPFIKQETYSRVEPIQWLDSEVPFVHEKLRDSANDLFYRVASKTQRLRAVSDARARNPDISSAESSKATSYSINLFDRAILERTYIKDMISEMKKTKDLAQLMCDVSLDCRTVGSLPRDILNLSEHVQRIFSIKVDVNVALDYAEQEVSRYGALKSKNTGIVGDLPFRNDTMEITEGNILLLRKCSNTIENFLALECISTIQKIHPVSVPLVTKNLAKAAADTHQKLVELRNSLGKLLSAAESISTRGLASNVLRPVLSFVRDAAYVSSQDGRTSRSEDVTESCSASITFEECSIARKCEKVIELALVAVQGMLGKSVEQEEESSHFMPGKYSNDVHGKAVDELERKILANGHLVIGRGLKSTNLQLMNDMLLDILDDASSMALELSGKDSFVENSQLAADVQFALRSLGSFLLCYLHSFPIPQVKKFSLFHMESLQLLKTIQSVFIGVLEEGFCRPMPSEEAPSDDVLPSTTDGTGFGDVGNDDISLAKDVSEEIHDEEQLLGLQDKDKTSETVGDPNVEEKNTDAGVGQTSGVEMSNDFEGSIEDGKTDENVEKNNSQEPGNSDEDVEKQFGDEPDEKAVDVDERLWNKESDEVDDDSQNGKAAGEVEPMGRKGETNLAAREDTVHESMNLQRNKRDREAEPKGKPDEIAPNDITDAGDSIENDMSIDDPLDNDDEADDPEDNDKRNTGTHRRDLKLNTDLEVSSSGDSSDVGDFHDDKCFQDDMVEDSESKDAQEDPPKEDLEDKEMWGRDATGEKNADQERGGIDQESTLDKSEERDIIPNDGLYSASDPEDGNEAEGPEMEDNASEMDIDNIPSESHAAEETHDAERSPDIDGMHKDVESVPSMLTPMANDTEAQTKENEVNLDPGTKTTQSTSERRTAETGILSFLEKGLESFSHPSSNFANENKSLAGGTEGGPGQDLSHSGNNYEEGSSNNPPPESSKQQQAQNDPNPYRLLKEDHFREEWQRALSVLEGENRTSQPSEDDNEEKNIGVTFEFIQNRDAPDVDDKSVLAAATKDQHQSMNLGDFHPNQEHINKSGEVSSSICSDEQSKDSAAVRKLSKAPDEKASKEAKFDGPEEGNVDSCDSEPAPDALDHPITKAMAQLEDIWRSKMRLKSLDSETLLGRFSTSEQHVEGPVSDMDATSLSDKKDVIFNPSESCLLDSSQTSNFQAIWGKLESLTESDSSSLCEQMRLVLQATVKSGLAGSFRSGKRLDMKKVIDFVASDFRRDRIWLRRTRPLKRSYDVVVAIDNSESMSDSGAGPLALAALVLLSSALSKLEVGRVGILKFGETCSLVRGLNETLPISDVQGGQILEQFSFSEKLTNVKHLLDFSLNFMKSAREEPSEEQVQILFIVSDGKLCDREELRRQLRHLAGANVLVGFIIVNSNVPDKGSIFDVKQVKYGPDGRVEVAPYMSDFPFKYYAVIHDVALLPSVLSISMRHWLEMMSKEVL